MTNTTCVGGRLNSSFKNAGVFAIVRSASWLQLVTTKLLISLTVLWANAGCFAKARAAELIMSFQNFKNDTVLAGHYGFTAEELDFILNYDIKYRLGRSTETDEE